MEEKRLTMITHINPYFLNGCSLQYREQEENVFQNKLVKYFYFVFSHCKKKWKFALDSNRAETISWETRQIMFKTLLVY